MKSYTKFSDHEHRISGPRRLPPMLGVMFLHGPVVALRATEMAIDVWDERDPMAAAGSIALLCRSVTSGHDMALYLEQSADDLRSVAAACMRAADLLDGGRGKQ